MRNRPPLSEPRLDSDDMPSGWPSATETASSWQIALDLYLADDVGPAVELINHAGLGEGGSYANWIWTLRAEAFTRSRSHVRRLGPVLNLEYTDSVALPFPDWAAEAVTEECERLAARFRWDWDRHVRVTILHPATEDRTAPFGDGYCIEKDPYSKICLPSYLLENPSEFRASVRHEFMHVITTDLADGRAPSWLEESLSVAMEDPVPEEDRQLFATGAWPWLTPNNLEAALMELLPDFEVDGVGPTEPAVPDGDEWSEAADAPLVERAYIQCGIIGETLLTIRDGETMRLLLNRLADPPPTDRLVTMLFLRDEVDQALRKLYGITRAELFGLARPRVKPIYRG